MPRSKALTTAVVVLAMLAAVAGNSSATRLSESEEQFRVTFASTLFFRSSEGENITCSATLEGRFANAMSFTKTAGTTYATVTGMRTSGCSITFLTENLPWTITYSSFSGMLPNITLVDTTINPFRFSWGSFFTCLYESNAATQEPFRFGRNTTSMVIEHGTFGAIATSLPSTDCIPKGIFVSGTGTFLTRNGTGVVRMTLI